MKPLVVFYSRTGTTKKVALFLAQKLSCPSIELIDLKKRSGPFGYLGGGRDAMKRILTQIKPLSTNPLEFDLIIIGSPVWASNMAPAVRTFLTQNNLSAKKTAFFCTAGGEDPGKTFGDMKELSASPLATLHLTTKEVQENTYQEKAENFAGKIK